VSACRTQISPRLRPQPASRRHFWAGRDYFERRRRAVADRCLFGL